MARCRGRVVMLAPQLSIRPYVPSPWPDEDDDDDEEESVEAGMARGSANDQPPAESSAMAEARGGNKRRREEASLDEENVPSHEARGRARVRVRVRVRQDEINSRHGEAASRVWWSERNRRGSRHGRSGRRKGRECWRARRQCQGTIGSPADNEASEHEGSSPRIEVDVRERRSAGREGNCTRRPRERRRTSRQESDRRRRRRRRRKMLRTRRERNHRRWCREPSLNHGNSEDIDNSRPNEVAASERWRSGPDGNNRRHREYSILVREREMPRARQNSNRRRRQESPPIDDNLSLIEALARERTRARASGDGNTRQQQELIPKDEDLNQNESLARERDRCNVTSRQRDDFPLDDENVTPLDDGSESDDDSEPVGDQLARMRKEREDRRIVGQEISQDEMASIVAVRNSSEENDSLFEQLEQQQDENERNADSSEPTEKCAICFDEWLERGEINCCNHFFCFHCIFTWSLLANTCPCCRQEFATLTRYESNNGVNSPVQIMDVPVPVPEPQQNQRYDSWKRETQGLAD